ncbi:MAG: hypothetical protein CMJ18_12540 [Phycisphaeraceae bacterium]|nr:hypothetical protein [Phycisphaeraceae bacterium]
MSEPIKAQESETSSPHQVNLTSCFVLLLLFTAAEILLYEVWARSAANGAPLIPKFAMVLVLLLVLTLPKAFIVATWFMHLRFERVLIVTLATVPLVTVGILILTITADIRTIAPSTYTRDVDLDQFETRHDHSPAPTDATGHAP